LSTFYRQFLLEDARTSSRAHLAAFGKHPGWNDHIDDLGLETTSLILTKQTIYLEGLSSQIDTGAWEKVGAEGLLDDYDHVFLWQRGLNLIVGALVASRDGKGRARYPMIVCAQFSGASPARVWRDWWPVVEGALQDCRATAAASAVIQILNRARETLRGATADATPHSSTSSAAARAPESLAGQPDLGPDNEGLYRLLYQVSNQLGAWAPGRVPAKLDAAKSRSVHLRLPQVFAAAPVGLQTWSAFFASQLDPTAPRLLLWPRAGTWLDVIIGRPTGADFFCLRANERTLPCTTRVPFTLEDSLRDRAQVVIDDLANRAAAPRSIFDRAVAKEAAARRKRRSGPSARGSRGWRWFASIVGLAAVAIGIYGSWYWETYRPGLPAETPTPPPESIEPASATINEAPISPTSPDPVREIALPTGAAFDNQRGVPQPEAASPEPAQAWASLCLAYDAWVGSLQQALVEPGRRERWAQMPYLQTHVLTPLDDTPPELGDLDPRKLAGVAGDLRTLQRSPPSALRDQNIQRQVVRAFQIVDRIAHALSNWTILADTRERTNQVKALGWSHIAAGIAFPDKLTLNDRLAPTMDRVLASWYTTSTLARLGADVLEGLKSCEDSGDPALASFGRWTRQQLLGIAVTADLERDLRQTQKALAPVLALLADDLQSGAIARDRFLRERGADWEDNATTADLLQRWTNGVVAYTVVPEDELPLATGEWQLRVQEVEEPLGQLETQAGEKTSAPYRARLTQLIAQWSALRNSKPLHKDAAHTQAAASDLTAAMRQLTADITKALDP
jgi:hypothetical protein